MVHRFTMTFQIQVSPLLISNCKKKILFGSSRAGPCVPQVQDDQAGQLDAVLRM
jgi:hypothetical protein